MEVALAECCGLLRREQATRDGDIAYDARVDAGTVILDLDEHHVPRALDPDRDRAFAVLAGRDANLGRLDPVIDRITHEVDERALERFEQATIQGDLGPDEGQASFFAEPPAQVAHRTLQRIE